MQRRRDENLRRRVEEPCDRRERRRLLRAFFGQSGVVEERIDEVGRCKQNTSFVSLIARVEIKINVPSHRLAARYSFISVRPCLTRCRIFLSVLTADALDALDADADVIVEPRRWGGT